MTEIIDNGPAPSVVNIEVATVENTNYRTTMWTGQHLQVTLMSIEPGGDIGLEVHLDTDQFLRIEEGQVTVLTGPTEDQLEARDAVAGEAVLVPAGTWHNLVNNGAEPFKVYSIYAPSHHPHGTVHVTKADGDAAEAAEHAEHTE